ncbi:MAG: 3'-5' exonuclease [Pseudomonadota bacterium]
MSFWRDLLGLGASRLSAEQQARLRAWRALPEPGLDLAMPLLRTIVADVEASGLNLFRDRLIAIGAVGIHESRIDYADSFHVVLRQEIASGDANILLHGIGGTEQTGGQPPAEALLGFLEFCGKAPLVGYHSPFDEIMLDKAMRRHLGIAFKRSWLDLSWLAPALLPERAKSCKSLDAWLEAFDIVNIKRHDALADALATAQLLQVLKYHGEAQGLRSAAALIEAARSQEWLAKTRK